MKLIDALQISVLSSGVVYCSSLYIGQVNLENIADTFLDSYITWLLKIFKFETRGQHGFKPSIYRTMLLRGLMAIFISIMFELSGYNIFTSLFNFIDIWSQLNAILRNTESPLYFLSYQLAAQTVLSILAILFANFIFDRLSIIKSFQIANIARKASIIKIPLFIAINVFLSFLLACSAVIVCFTIDALVAYCFVLLSFYENVDFEILMNSWYIDLYDIMRSRILNYVFTVDIYHNIVGINSLNIILSEFPYIGPVFCTTFITVAWFFIYYFTVLIIKMLQSFRSIDTKLSVIGENRKSGYIVGGVASGATFILFWAWYILHGVI